MSAHDRSAAYVLARDGIRYSQVWEDYRLLEEGLNIGPGDDVLSITSAGCNVLALLLQEPRSITAVDINPAQNALLQLKVAGIRRLTHPEFIALLGVRGGFDRRALYRRLRSGLPEEARLFWDTQPREIEEGVVHCGRLERYIRAFQTEYLAKCHSLQSVLSLLDQGDLREQARFFAEVFSTPVFREIFSWYFGREMMGKNGRDPVQFRFVEQGDIGAYFLERFTFACTALPLKTNFYVEFFLTSRYRDLDSGPPYLRPENFERLKNLLDRLTVVTDDVEHHVQSQAKGTFSKANLSDLFEYLSPQACERLHRTLGTQFRNGGRLAYWNLLVPRSRPECLASLLRPRSEFAHSLWKKDRSWFYRAFHIAEVLR
jgi:S-adenosylmethionine-diacylglycerol 3-amino-3-carboxypropyl transferase